MEPVEGNSASPEATTGTEHLENASDDFPIVAFAYAFYYTIGDLALAVAMGESTSFPADATHVPTFYVPSHRYPEYLHALLLIALGSIFGAIHCAGWNFPFPASAEQKLWFVASLAVTIVPIAVLPFAAIVSGIVELITTFNSSSDADESPFAISLLISMFAYVSARLVLLVLALALLRDLPPNAYIAVDWTKFYPHIL